MLSFQRLDVYKCAIEFLALSTRLLATVPRGNGPLTDQLRRAALSVPLNIAEAAGRTSDPDGARHDAIDDRALLVGELVAVAVAVNVNVNVNDHVYRRSKVPRGFVRAGFAIPR